MRLSILSSSSSSSCYCSRIAASLAAVVFVFVTTGPLVDAWDSCGRDSRDVCPDGNTCCPVYNEDGISLDGMMCLSGKEQSGDCCYDEDDNEEDRFFKNTGCAEGFECAYNTGANVQLCQRRPGRNDEELPDQLPRYRLCRVPPEALQRVYGLPIVIPNDHETTTTTTTTTNESSSPQFAYLSSMKGALDDDHSLQQLSLIETIVIVIHGSGRNPDDYLCSTTAAAAIHNNNNNNKSSILVLAPWFAAPEDNVTLWNRSPTVDALRWEDSTGIIYHSFRYGANALNTPNNVSSYAAVDAMLDFLVDRHRFPRLHKIVVAGHSAGGQYTHRWALLSNHGVLESSDFNVRVVVANPKSFCYLDAHRFVPINNNNNNDVVYKLPTMHEIDNCTTYNDWEWGLNDTILEDQSQQHVQSQFLPTPYKDKAIQQAGGLAALKRRYVTRRDVVYLSGELDILENGDCQARAQGPYRRLRSDYYFQHLQKVFEKQPKQKENDTDNKKEKEDDDDVVIVRHHRLVVKGVHHDHALMFQSPEGQQALFGWFSKFHQDERGDNNDEPMKLKSSIL